MGKKSSGSGALTGRAHWIPPFVSPSWYSASYTVLMWNPHASSVPSKFQFRDSSFRTTSRPR